MAAPKVSVVLPVRDSERFVRQALESVLGQTLQDIELVVVDDGSTDATPAIIEEYAADDPRVVAERQPPSGSEVARSRAFALARAPLVANMDADDVAVPERLAQQLAFMTEHPDVSVLGGAVLFIDEDGREFGEWQYPLEDEEIRRVLAQGSPFVHPATMIRKDAFCEVGGYRALFPADDLDLWLRLAEGNRFANLPSTVLRYRVHPGQSTIQRCEVQALYALAARCAATMRANGERDPLDTDANVDEEFLRGLGVDHTTIAAAVVAQLTWVARLTGRAGYDAESERLFAAALQQASRGGLSSEAAEVHLQHARVHRERGRRARAAVEHARSRLASRRR